VLLALDGAHLYITTSFNLCICRCIIAKVRNAIQAATADCCQLPGQQHATHVGPKLDTIWLRLLISHKGIKSSSPNTQGAALLLLLHMG
jgi:hypothetical protein